MSHAKSSTREELLWYDMHQAAQMRIASLERKLARAVEVLETCALPSPHVAGSRLEFESVLKELKK